MTTPLGDWPPPLHPDVNPDDVDAGAMWQQWVDEAPDDESRPAQREAEQGGEVKL